MSITEFPGSVIERIGFYVYLLRDPRDGSVFYVGKGAGNRVFGHVREAVESPRTTDKLDRIREIKRMAEEVLHPVDRQGDRQGCSLDAEGNVTTPEGYKGVWRTLAEEKPIRVRTASIFSMPRLLVIRIRA